MNIFTQAFRKIRIGITKFISKIKYTPYPFFIIYNERTFLFDDTYAVLDIVQPGDILLKTYDSFLTKFFIPGKWKHAALALDNRNVIQAITKGVEISDIVQFCRTDHVMVLRMPDLTTQQINDILNLAKQEIGKPYDYDFILNNSSKFYCSELIIFAYNGLLKIVPTIDKLFGIIPSPPLVSPSDLANCSQLKVIYQST